MLPSPPPGGSILHDHFWLNLTQPLTDLLLYAGDEAVLEKTRRRMEDIGDLIAEKAIYRRIDENARQVLTEIGVNISDNHVLLDLLMDAGRVDYDNETALFIPLKREYINRCLEQTPRKMPCDPGGTPLVLARPRPF